ncbi:MAG: hypothetical protein RL092_1105 [Bacteroidota bacterium]|jgi:hypothetical protein
MKVLLKKMKTSLLNGVAHYELGSGDCTLVLNSIVGRHIEISHTGSFFCLNHHGPIKKTFGEGLCWKCFNESASASPCIIRPELCRIHEGIALRGDLNWEMENHMQEHFVYLSFTSGLKVGVTRCSNLHSRWIDQGAKKAIVLARVPYRQLAGEIEVVLKQFIADKTNWKQMLLANNAAIDMKEHRERVIDLLPEHYQDFVEFDSDEIAIEYPVQQHPIKPHALKLESAKYSGRLKGVIGQYLLLENDLVFNVRANSGMEIQLITEE